MKKVLYGILILLVIVAGGAYYLMNNLGWVVKKVVNKYGSEVIGTAVDIDGFDLSITDGTASIKRLTLANPKGYKTPYLFDMEEIAVKIDVKSLTSNTIVINKIEVKKPDVTYEMVSLTKNNISDIQKNISNYSAKSAKTAKTETKKETQSSGSETKVIIDNLTVDKGSLRAVTYLQDKETSANVSLPVIMIKDIGKSKKGDDIATVISKIMSQILTTASQTIVNNNLADLKGVAQENLDNAVSSAKDRVNETKEIFNNLTKF